MVHQYGIDTGLNQFRLGDANIETSFKTNNCLELLLSGGANPSLYDAKEAVKSMITLPAAYDSNRNVPRLHILCRIILPPAHHLTAFL